MGVRKGLTGFTEGLRVGGSLAFRAATSDVVHGWHVPSLSSRMSVYLQQTQDMRIRSLAICQSDGHEMVGWPCTQIIDDCLRHSHRS